MTRLGPIAYVSHLYPHLTETFVYREVQALRRRGVDVRTYGAWRPAEAAVSLEARGHIQETTYVFPLALPAFVASHVRFLLTRPRRYLGALFEVLAAKGDRLTVRGLGALHFLMGVHLARAMERAGAIHVHAQFSVHAATMGLVAARLLGLTFSFTAHNLLFTRRMALREKIRAAAFIVAISEDTRRFVLDAARPLDASRKVHVVHCGVPAQTHAAARSRASDAPPSILFLAQLQPRKGAPLLIEALAHLRRRGAAFRCVLVGDGPDRVAVEAAIRRHGLQDDVVLAGALPQEEVGAHLDAADLFVLPCVTAPDGDRDGIPVALMEAMSRGLPVVSTRVSGIPELIEDGRSGLLVDERDAAGLADAFARLCTDVELRERLGRAGRARVADAFDLERSAAALAELLGRHARSTA